MDAKIVKRNDSASFSCGKNHDDVKIYGFRKVSRMRQATQITIRKPRSHDKPPSASSAFLREKPPHEAMMDFQNSTNYFSWCNIMVYMMRKGYRMRQLYFAM